jgi:hypothetical protein
MWLNVKQKIHLSTSSFLSALYFWLQKSSEFVSDFWQVGEDVVAELQMAMEKEGVDMRVAALVRSLLF